MHALGLLAMVVGVPLAARSVARSGAWWWVFGALVAGGYLAFLDGVALARRGPVRVVDVVAAALFCAPWVGGWAWWGRSRAPGS